MTRFARAVVYGLLVVMTLSASDWPYFDEIVEDLGSQLEPATLSQAEENPSREHQGTTSPNPHALHYQLLLVLQGIVPTKLKIPAVDTARAAPQEAPAIFRSEFPEGLYRPPNLAPIV